MISKSKHEIAFPETQKFVDSKHNPTNLAQQNISRFSQFAKHTYLSFNTPKQTGSILYCIPLYCIKPHFKLKEFKTLR